MMRYALARKKEAKEEWKEREDCRMPAGRVKGEASPGHAGP
ncbi:hypothetical protein EDE09_11346 [Neorhizobium sp. S3-V5DH]|nr:hypothetical protein EDE09_11346 [Neorhizobium sp. S3-V5DH]